MMKIVVNEKNLPRIEAALEEVQGKCTTRTITARNILDFCEGIHEFYRLPKTALDGAFFRVDLNAQKFPNAYKYIPYSTHFEVECHKGRYTLVGITRQQVNAPTRAARAVLPEEVQKALLNRFGILTSSDI